jgi:mRNA-degrading endonuclease RelE of RelBE toxin-antitoxin system
MQALPAGHVTRLQGQQEERFRLRVGDWRVIFTMDAAQQTIFVSLIRPRGDAYRP